MGIKTYNSLAPYIKAEFNNIIKFEYLLKKFLWENTFYSMNFSILNKGQSPITYLYLCALCVFINHVSYYNLVYIKQFFTTLIKLYLLQTNTTTCILFLYTGCPRRNVPDFGRVFLMLNYTDITQNTYVQSGTVTEIMAREV